LNGQVPDVAASKTLHPTNALPASNVPSSSKGDSANHSSLDCRKFEKSISSGIQRFLRWSFSNRYGAVNEMAWCLHYVAPEGN
jgi:hypothetical protein